MKKETREQLEQYIMQGEHAASAQYIIDVIGNHLIEEIKNNFLKLPILNNQDIDMKQVYMLQLKAEAVNEFKALIRSYIAKGLEAKKKLNGEYNG